MDKRGLFGIDSSAFSLKGEKIMYRDHTKVVQIGDKKIGGGNSGTSKLNNAKLAEEIRF